MNKQQKIALVIISIMAFILGLLEAYRLQQNIYKDKLPEHITSQSWERDNGSDIETIYFDKDGKFGYYCSCGSPVDYYDACDSYKFDKETNTIKLKCLPVVKPSKIKIISSTEEKLILDFNGEKREFITQYKHLIDNPLSFAGIKFKTTNTKEEIEIEFTKDGNFEAYNTTKKKYDLGSDICFNWTSNKENNEIILDCQDHKRTIKINKYDPKTNELELYFKHNKKTYNFIKIEDNK